MEARVQTSVGVIPMAVALSKRSWLELLVLFLHSFEELFCTHVPIDLVGFGDEEAGQGLFVVSQFLLECGVVHQSGYFGGVYHELFAYAACQPVQCACAADGEIRRFLISAVQTAEYVIYVFPGRMV